MADQGLSSLLTIQKTGGLGALHKLPPELRQMVWQYLVLPASPTDAELNQRRHQPCNLSAQPPTAAYGTLSILRASRQICDELYPELYRKRSLAISLNTADIRTPLSGMPLLFEIMFSDVPSLRSLQHADLSRFEHIKLYIVLPNASKDWTEWTRLSHRIPEVYYLLLKFASGDPTLLGPSLWENTRTVAEQLAHLHSCFPTSPSSKPLPSVSMTLDNTEHEQEEYLLDRPGWQAATFWDFQYLGYILDEARLSIEVLHDQEHGPNWQPNLVQVIKKLMRRYAAWAPDNRRLYCSSRNVDSQESQGGTSFSSP
ncbi:MAG: hypothetical protein LQ350_004170 [Teloschistes chrysophthalmus]|nr:MAG: hypothetical protein LQ350_004170 [Niorma chrysophthalma]